MTPPEIYLLMALFDTFLLVSVVYMAHYRQLFQVSAIAILIAVVMLLTLCAADQDARLVRAYARQTGIPPEIVAERELFFLRGDK